MVEYHSLVPKVTNTQSYLHPSQVVAVVHCFHIYSGKPYCIITISLDSSLFYVWTKHLTNQKIELDLRLV